MPTAELRPSRIGAPGSLNIDTREQGRAVPAFRQFVLESTDRLNFAVTAIEHKAPPTAAAGQAPRQYSAIARTVLRLDNGTITEDQTFTSFVKGMAIVDNGSGIPILLVTFGSLGGSEVHAWRDLTTDASPWTTASGVADFAAHQIVRAGADLYAVTDAGTVPAANEWRVSKCPAGNDPRLQGSWGNGIEVGGPEWGINGLAAIGDAPVAGKADGLYYYDTQTRRFENVMAHLALVPHGLNGRVTQSVQNGVVYTTWDGHAFFFDGVSVTEISPHKFWPILSRDIGNVRITAVADAGEFIAMYTESAALTTQNANLAVYKVTSGDAETSLTANVTDGDFTTGGNVNSLAATSHIDIWADVPFEGAVLHVTRRPNSVNAAVFGSVSYSQSANTFTADPNGFYDGTRLARFQTTLFVSGSLSHDTYPPIGSPPAVYGKSLNFGSLQQRISYDYNGVTISNKYGMRISMSGAALHSGTEIDEVEIIPFRPGMPNGGIYSTTTNFTARDRAGLIGHVYLIKREKTTGFVPHDVYACDTGPGVWAMAWHGGRLGQDAGGQNLGQSLILWGRYKIIAISEAPTRDPVRTRYPLLQQVSTTAPGPLLQIAHEWRGRTEREWNKLKQIKKLSFDTRYVQPSDAIEVFAEIDGVDIVSLGKYTGGPLFVVPANIPPFRWINLWIGFSQAASTLENAPYFVEPYLIEYVTVDGEPAQDRATAVPSLV